jgi:hypothetical protein
MTIKEYWQSEYKALQERMKNNPLCMSPAYLLPEIAYPIIEKIIRLTLANIKEPILECEMYNYFPATLSCVDFREIIANYINEKRGIYSANLKIYSTNRNLYELFLDLGDQETFISMLVNRYQQAYKSAYLSNIKPDFGHLNGYNLYCGKTEILNI